MENVLPWLAVGVAVWALTSKTTTKDNVFFVPGIGDVPESRLPELGYIKYNGLWFKESDLLAAAASQGVTSPGNIDINTQVGVDIFLALLQAGTSLATTLINNSGQRKADLVDQIYAKYMVPVSSTYDASFPYTESQLEKFTIKQLEDILGGDFTISGIYRTQKYWMDRL
ncbi:hypothetical protein [Winogradskyella sp.]|uniref:hypothetical protein n=1 Tax=Winogradskyella sp. TaxID=1883156 RepID=UPI002608E9E9|nr:hypothetical protein [Winogradskyella sp.]